MLEANAFSVVEARNGREALHLLTSDDPPPDLILLDLRMPQMTGWELVALIKSYAPLAEIPIVVMSALEPYARVLGGGVAEIVRKPIKPEALFKTLEQVAARTLPRLR